MVFPRGGWQVTLTLGPHFTTMSDDKVSFIVVDAYNEGSVLLVFYGV